jgi:hypothetical protein
VMITMMHERGLLGWLGEGFLFMFFSFSYENL